MASKSARAEFTAKKSNRAGQFRGPGLVFHNGELVGVQTCAVRSAPKKIVKKDKRHG